RRLSPGQLFLIPDGVPLTATAGAGEYLVLGVPRTAAGSLAEEKFGLPAGRLRFAAMTPPFPPARPATFARTAAYLCGELVTSEVTEMYALQLATLTRQTAAAFLET